MLNYVALFWVQFWVFGPWSKGGFQETEPFPPEAVLPRLTDFAATFPALGGLTTHLGLIFGIVAAAIMWVALERTRWGYEIRLIGDSPRAARYAGIDIARKIIIVFVISGALAGLGGMSEVGGVVHRLQDRISPGYGFTAIIIAYLARFGPFRVDRRVDPVRCADPRRPRDPAVGRPGDDPGHHPVLAHRQRRADPLPGPVRSAGWRPPDGPTPSWRPGSPAARSCCSRRSARSSPSGAASSTSASRG